MDRPRTLHRARTVAVFLVALAIALPARAGQEPKAAPAASTDDELPPDDLVTAEAETAPKKSGSIGLLTDELSTDKADSTPANPRAGGVRNHLAASFNLGEEWALDLGFDYSTSQGTPPPPGSAFGDNGGKSTSFSLGVDWDPNDHYSLGASVNFSPKSTTISGTSLTFSSNGKDVATDARLRADNSSGSAALSFSYDTAGESTLEWTVAADVTGAHLDTAQVVTAVQRADGQVISKQQLVTYCNANPKKCSRALAAALRERDYQLDSLVLGGSVMATIFTDTDVRLGGDVWAYSEDPTDVGFFSIAGGKAAGVQGGGGVPIAPMRADLKLDVTHRFGDFSAKLSASGGSYVAGTGGGTYGGGLKLQYKFTKRFRLWLIGSIRHDVDDAGRDSVSRSGSLGAGLRF